MAAIPSSPVQLPDDVSSGFASAMITLSEPPDDEPSGRAAEPPSGTAAEPPELAAADAAAGPALNHDMLRDHELSSRRTACRCKTECLSLFKSESEHMKLQELRLNFDTVTTEERNKRVFHFVQQQVQGADGAVVPRAQYFLLSRPVCLPTFCHLTGISKNKVAQVKDLIGQGHLQSPPVRLTRMSTARDNAASDKADGWFLTLYESFAQTYAEGDMDREGDQQQDPLMEEVVSAGHPLYLLAAGADGERTIPIRKLPPMAFEDLFMLHKVDLCEDAVSKETLRVAWKTRWSQYMPIRKDGTQSRCQECADICEERRGLL